jgi:hypothetical protein
MIDIEMNRSVNVSVKRKREPSLESLIFNKETTWPTVVKCEMKVDVWERELRKFDLLDEYQYLLDGFLEGFHQGVPKHKIKNSKWFCPPNHSSAEKAREKIEASIQKEIGLKRMFGPYSKDEVYNKLGFFRTSPLGAVENRDGSFRPINDMSFPRFETDIPSVNSFVNKKDFETT